VNRIDLSPAYIGWAVDGCNLPTLAVPLQSLATLYARLAHAADEMAQAALPGSALPTVRTRALARIFAAMNAHPELVAGHGRFCTALMTAYPGILIGKVGADGCYAVGLRAATEASSVHHSRALGVAVKVEDGNNLMVPAIVCEVLRQLQVPLTAGLRDFYAPPIVNTIGERVGHIEIALSLRTSLCVMIGQCACGRMRTVRMVLSAIWSTSIV
jgi:L-asparaginase II